jgi:hypothetical protein
MIRTINYAVYRHEGSTLKVMVTRHGPERPFPRWCDLGSGMTGQDLVLSMSLMGMSSTMNPSRFNPAALECLMQWAQIYRAAFWNES